nr:2-succinyl-6-hydroxy-2,4-cyclohexadiene-1-carboxylate synthase [Vibrio methylphosphonaticus]
MSTRFLPGCQPHIRRPILVFVHGFLGSTDDWCHVTDELTDYPRLFLDLPGHGLSDHVTCSGFEEASVLLGAAIQHAFDAHHIDPMTPVCLIGYSLGARLLMYCLTMHPTKRWCSNPILGLVIEGGNFGLKNHDERQQRLVADQAWARRFQIEKIEDVLADWYRQPVFSSLNHEQRQLLIAKRSVNLGHKLSTMLDSTSLGRQPYLLEEVQQLSFDSGHTPLFISGENDTKFTALARLSGLNHYVVPHAGHNVHKEHPKAFTSALLKYINTPN